MLEKVRELLVEELQVNPDDVTMDAELSKDLGINSIEQYELAMMCEEKFGVEINDEEFHKFVTIGDVVNYLEAHQ